MTLFFGYMAFGALWVLFMCTATFFRPTDRFYWLKRFVYPVYTRMGGVAPFMEEVLSDDMDLPAATTHALLYACAWPLTLGWSLVWALCSAVAKRVSV